MGLTDWVAFAGTFTAVPSIGRALVAAVVAVVAVCAQVGAQAATDAQAMVGVGGQA